jgi:hypothetical protein
MRTKGDPHDNPLLYAVIVAIDNVSAIAKVWAETECRPEANFLPEQWEEDLPQTWTVSYPETLWA